MIPKVIHYCWFGEAELPELAIKCIESWRKFCPDYVIQRWDETNFDCNCCEYVKEAYNEKKWAFVSDYARFWILYNYGGIYFDTDVELIKPIDDVVEAGPFMGCEPGDPLPNIAPGLGLGANKGIKIFKEILNSYEKQKFKNEDGTLNTETVVTKVSCILKKKGFKGDGKIEKIEEVMIYPSEYFCPKDYYSGKLTIKENTYSIHHYSASWYEPEEEKSHHVKQKIISLFGLKIGLKMYKPIYYYYRIRLHYRKNGGILQTIKFIYNKFKN